MDRENKAFKLSDEDLTQVSGGAPLTIGGGSCPNNYTECTEANCMNPRCTYLRAHYNEYLCSQLVSGCFTVNTNPLSKLKLTQSLEEPFKNPDTSDVGNVNHGNTIPVFD